jgi:hypothetical protein
MPWQVQEHPQGRTIGGEPMIDRSVNPGVRRGDGFAYDAGAKKRTSRGHRRTEADLQAALREEHARLGRDLTPSELDKFTREFYAPEYRADVRAWMRGMGIAYGEDGEEV